MMPGKPSQGIITEEPFQYKKQRFGNIEEKQTIGTTKQIQYAGLLAFSQPAQQIIYTSGH